MRRTDLGGMTPNNQRQFNPHSPKSAGTRLHLSPLCLKPFYLLSPDFITTCCDSNNEYREQKLCPESEDAGSNAISARPQSVTREKRGKARGRSNSG